MSTAPTNERSAPHAEDLRIAAVPVSLRHLRVLQTLILTNFQAADQNDVYSDFSEEFVAFISTC